jgi:3-oxoacyl-[acyl-carrier-protein] synthase III
MVYLHGVGHYHPPTVISNEFLESLDIGVDQDWILERVGIRERRTVLSLDYIRQTRNADTRLAAEHSTHSNAQTGKLAAEHAILRAGISAQEIGMVIAGGCSPQSSTPAEASTIAAELGISATVFDLNSACSSFVAQLHFLNLMRSGELPDFVLLVNPENNTRTVDYSDRRTAVLWGDATSAAVVSTRVPARSTVTFSMQASDPAGWEKVRIPQGGHFTQDGSAVQNFAIRRTVSTFDQLRQRIPDDAAAGSAFIGHQANLMMLRTACDRAGIPSGSHLFNVDRFGNCGAAGAPSVLSQAWDSYEGDWIAMAVVGSGLSWGGALINMNNRSKVESEA